MKIILELDIKDDKAEFVMELLRSLSFVKAKPITKQKAQIMADIREAVEEVNQIKAGKIKARNARDFVKELK